MGKNHRLSHVFVYLPMIIPCSPTFIKNNFKEFNFKFMIEIDLLWEVMNAQLWGIFMAYASKKKRNLNEEEKKLNTKIEHLEKGLGKNISNNEWIRELMENKEKLENNREHKLKGALIRSRWQQSSMGEKPSSFFLI